MPVESGRDAHDAMALIDCHFYSRVLGLMSTMTVILPEPQPPEPGVTPARTPRRYPTLYLLHGLSDDHSAWQRRTAIERYVDGLNLAVVMLAVQRSYYTDTVTGQRYQWCGMEDFLYADNVRFHEHTEALGLAVTYAEGPGGHEWSCWDAQIQQVLAWLPGKEAR